MKHHHTGTGTALKRRDQQLTQLKNDRIFKKRKKKEIWQAGKKDDRIAKVLKKDSIWT